MAIARPVDRRLYYIFDRTHARLAKLADARLAKTAGIKTAQASALVYLGYHNGCLLNELADGVGHNNSAITGLIDRMEKSELVNREMSHIDRRSKTVSLTSKGWALRESVMNENRDFNEIMVRNFSEAEMAAVYKFLTLAPDNFVEKSS